MAITSKGRSGWFLENIGTLQTDRFGMSTATARWRQLDAATGAAPLTPVVFGGIHPVWNFLTCDKVSMSHDEGRFWTAEANFFGVSGSPQPLYELDLSTSEEPIETHKNFKDFATDANGAQFDYLNDGSFLGFTRRPTWSPPLDVPTPRAPTNEQWIGVTSYLAPGATWRKNYVSTSQPSDLSGVGLIGTPEGSPPAVESGRTWLFKGITWDQRGLVYQVRKEWLLSGRRGWNTVIYA